LENEKQESPEKEALEILEKYRRVKLNEEKERQTWLRCYQYVNNWVDNDLGQWKKETRNRMGDNPTLSIPLVKKFINRIAGAQVSAKIDEKCYPRDDKGDAIIAEILTDLKSYVYYLNQTEYQKARAFRDMLITGRGFIQNCWSDELDPLGEITTRRINPFRVYLIGDKEEYDVSKMEAVIDETNVSFDKLKSMYPEKAEELEAMKNGVEETGGLQVAGYDYSPNNEYSYDDEVKDSETGKYRILRLQKYEYVPVTLIDIPEKGLTEIPEKELKAIEKQFGLKLPVIKKKQKKVRIITVCGNVVLENEISKYKHNKFDIVGWFAYNDNGRVTGVAQDLLDVQDEKNKRRSQIIKMLGTAAKNSYWTKKGALDDVEDAKKNLGKTGTIIEVNGDINNAVKPIDSNMNALPAIAGMEEKAEMDFNSVSGLTDASLGQVPDGVKSGRGINQLQQGVEVIISELFEHHLMSCKLLAELTIANIQQYYTEPRRIRVLGDYSAKFIPPELQQRMDMGIVQAVQEGAKIIQINNSKLNDITVGRYDIVIDATNANATTRQAQYYAMLNMKQMGAPIQWSDIIKYSDIRGSQELSQKAFQAEQMLSQISGLPPQVAPTPKPEMSGSPMPADLSQNTAGAQSPM